MKKKILLFGLFAITVFGIEFSYANATSNHINDYETNSILDFSENTTYEAENYVPPIEIYNIDLEWDDLYWVLVHSKDITNQMSQIWITKKDYDYYRNGQGLNEFNSIIINNITQYQNHDEVQISITNYSVFAVDIDATIEPKKSEDYINSSKFEVISENSSNWSTRNASIDGLRRNNSSYFKIKPQSSEFVDSHNSTLNVTETLKIFFKKST